MFKLDKAGRIKIAKWAVIATIGALFTYLESIIVHMDFWTYWPIVMAVNTIFVNIVRKWLTDNAPTATTDLPTQPQ